MSHLEADLAGRTERVMLPLVLEVVKHNRRDAPKSGNPQSDCPFCLTHVTYAPQAGLSVCMCASNISSTYLGAFGHARSSFAEAW